MAVESDQIYSLCIRAIPNGAELTPKSTGRQYMTLIRRAEDMEIKWISLQDILKRIFSLWVGCSNSLHTLLWLEA